MTDVTIRTMRRGDWPEVKSIYVDGIQTGHATFETAPPANWATFDASKHPRLKLVAIGADARVLGWATASPTSTRAIYSGVVEDSVYVHPDASGRGIGGVLLAALIDLATQVGVWTIQSSIFPENATSIRLHERHGFRVVGTRERIARMTYGPKAGRWRDTVFLERRSAEH